MPGKSDYRRSEVILYLSGLRVNQEEERRKREKNERNGLTLTGLLMEGVLKPNLVTSVLSQVSDRRRNRVLHNGSDGWRRVSPILRAGRSRSQDKYLSIRFELPESEEASLGR